MTPCDHYHSRIVQTMTTEWAYHVNKVETLVDDLQVLRTPISYHHAITMDKNKTIQLSQALNYICDENNKMAIRRNKYFMLKEMLCSALECGRRA